LLAPQLIYQGTTERCHLKYRLPPEFLVDHTSSHWSDAELMIRYVKAILILYFVNKCIELCLPESQVAIAIFDVNASHRFNDKLHSILKDNLIEFVYISACCTSELQPLDADGGPNGKLKRLLKNEFSLWYSEELMDKLELGSERIISKPNLNVSFLKPMHALWFEKSFAELKKSSHISCWQQTGILQKIHEVRNEIVVGID